MAPALPLTKEQVPRRTIHTMEFVMVCPGVTKGRRWTGGSFTSEGRRWSVEAVIHDGTMKLRVWGEDLGDDEIGVVHAKLVDRRPSTPAASQVPYLHAIVRFGQPCSLAVPSTVPEMVKNGIVFKDSIAISVSAFAFPDPHKHSHLSRDLGLALESGDGHDITFRVGDEEFHAHKSVVLARCPALAAEILDATPGTVVSLEATTEPKAFGVFLKFLYTEDVPGAAEVLGQSYTKELELLLMQEVYDVADKFQQKELKAMLEKRMVREMNVSTAARTLAFAERHGCEFLQAGCSRKIVSRGWLREVLCSGEDAMIPMNAYPTDAKDALLLEAALALMLPRV